MKLRRTVVRVDEVVGSRVTVTPAGVDIPAASVVITLDRFPRQLRTTVELGRVFFAYVNLGARSAGDVRIERIEEEWGDTGPLHLDREEK